MIRTPEIIFGYENLARLQIDKGNYENAREQLKKALKTIKREKFNDKDAKEIVSTMKNIFDDFIKLGDPVSCLDTISLIHKISEGKLNLNSYGEIFIDKFDSSEELTKHQTSLEQLLPPDGSAIKKLHSRLLKGATPETKKARQEDESFKMGVKAEENVASKAEVKEAPLQQIAQETGKEVNVAPGAPNDIIELKLALAKAEMNRKNLESSVRILNEILAEKPDNAEATNLLRSLRETEEKMRMVNQAKEKMSKMDLKTPEENEIVLLVLTDEFEKANDLVTKAITKERENPRLWFIKAIISKKLGKANLYTNFEGFAKKVDPNITKTKLYSELSKLYP